MRLVVIMLAGMIWLVGCGGEQGYIPSYSCTPECDSSFEVCSFDGVCIAATGKCLVDTDCFGETPKCNIETHLCQQPYDCYDLDNDGYGSFCEKGPDCDDSNPDIHPDAEEICGNNIDDNCNGVRDEFCKCTDGAIEVCYSGPEGTKGKGLCVSGFQTCADEEFGACIGEVLPDIEVCDGIDNDCDGETDEGFQLNACGECIQEGDEPLVEICGNGQDDNCNNAIDEGCPACDDGAIRNCYPGSPQLLGIGACKGGVQTCDKGVWNECDGSIVPEDESCDGIDNDCDGEVDEGVKNACGGCGDVPEEVLDGEDNNCDGVVDEGFTVNACGEPCIDNGDGTFECPVVPEEICGDGRDNNCDQYIDEGCTCETSQSCYGGAEGTAGVGECKQGTQDCVGSEGYDTECKNQVLPTLEICDGKDNDCDNDIDEGFNVGGECYAGKGACAVVGVIRCTTTGGVECVDATTGDMLTPKEPTKEICDQIDNDCDGTIDDGYELAGTTCGKGVGVCRGEGVYICGENQESVVCTAVEHPENKLDHEICGNGDGTGAGDDNCNGYEDEGFELYGVACEVGVGACQRVGLYSCNGAKDGLICADEETGELEPGTPVNELCGNNKDDNCNGLIDEGFDRIGNDCDDGLKGICHQEGSTYRCIDGLMVCQSDTVVQPLSQELCDGTLDENCDGFVDEGFDLKGSVCSVGLGICQSSGVYACSSDGSDLACVNDQGGAIQPGTPLPQELCNGIDDDCDGILDNGFELKGSPCSVGLGICKVEGVYSCSNDESKLECVDTDSGVVLVAKPKLDNELCGNNKDDNCNGLVDEGFKIGASCNNGGFGALGECYQAGVWSCDTDSGAEVCKDGNTVIGMSIAAVDALKQGKTESCDGQDNDCDGDIDEDFTTGATALYSSCTSPESYGGSPVYGVCITDGIYLCNDSGTGTECNAETENPAGKLEICGDSKDNDCDGKTDDEDSDCDLSVTCGSIPSDAVMLKKVIFRESCSGECQSVDDNCVCVEASVSGIADSILWSVVSEPSESTVILKSPTSSTSSFLPIIPGSYTIRFDVTTSGKSEHCEWTIPVNPADSLNVSASWDQPADFDLHLLRPDLSGQSNWNDASEDCYYNNCRICPIDEVIPGETCSPNANIHWFDGYTGYQAENDPGLSIDNRIGCKDSSDNYCNRGDADCSCFPENISIYSPYENSTNYNYTVGVYYFSGQPKGREGEAGPTQNVTVSIHCRDAGSGSMVENKYTCSNMAVGNWCFVRDVVWNSNTCTISSASRTGSSVTGSYTGTVTATEN